MLVDYAANKSLQMLSNSCVNKNIKRPKSHKCFPKVLLWQRCANIRCNKIVEMKVYLKKLKGTVK